MLVFSLLLCLLASSFLSAQSEPPSPPTNASQPTPSLANELALSQSELADRYRRLEKLLLRMAEFDAATNPRRAEILKQAVARAKNQHLDLQFETLVKLLNDEQLGRAVGNQRELRTDLENLLKLLMTENRTDRLKNEKARIREYIREVERLERMQRSVQGRTDGGADGREVTPEQREIAERTGRLRERIEEKERPPGGEGAAEVDSPSTSDDPAAEEQSPSTEGDPSDSPSAEPSPSEEQRSSESQEPGEPSEASEKKPGGQPGENAPSESGKPGEDPPGESSPSSSESNPPPADSSPSGAPPSSGSPGDSQSPSSPPPESFPGQQNLQQAQQAMERAVEKLDKAQREGAVDEQREAARELAQAKARLEEILRQLRDEEIERTLALLETRIKRMLEAEVRIHDETVRLDQAMKVSEDRGLEIEAGRLSFEQRRVASDAEKALMLLREEGSSAAFPETLEQARDDMQQVASRLAQAKAGTITQSIEDDIISALEEMLEALQQAQQEQQQRNQQNAPPSGEPGDQPLVDQIAELKMIKALQLRINRRTVRYSRLLQNIEDPIGQATDEELIDALQELSHREMRLHDLTRDIVLGKNR